METESISEMCALKPTQRQRTQLIDAVRYIICRRSGIFFQPFGVGGRVQVAVRYVSPIQDWKVFFHTVQMKVPLNGEGKNTLFHYYFLCRGWHGVGFPRIYHWHHHLCPSCVPCDAHAATILQSGKSQSNTWMPALLYVSIYNNKSVQVNGCDTECRPAKLNVSAPRG